MAGRSAPSEGDSPHETGVDPSIAASISPRVGVDADPGRTHRADRAVQLRGVMGQDGVCSDESWLCAGPGHAARSDLARYLASCVGGSACRAWRAARKGRARARHLVRWTGRPTMVGREQEAVGASLDRERARRGERGLGDAASRCGTFGGPRAKGPRYRRRDVGLWHLDVRMVASDRRPSGMQTVRGRRSLPSRCRTVTRRVEESS